MERNKSLIPCLYLCIGDEHGDLYTTNEQILQQHLFQPAKVTIEKGILPRMHDGQKDGGILIVKVSNKKWGCYKSFPFIFLQFSPAVIPTPVKK